MADQTVDGVVRYDTVGGRLAAAGARLERRNGVWRLRLPKERGAARLVELPVGPEGWLPPPVSELVLGLARTEPVVPASKEASAAAARHPSASEPEGIVGRALARSFDRLVRNDGLVRLGDDDEAVHQARVAVRTLRNDLRTFAPLLHAEPATALRGDLEPLASALGALRDTDVLTGRLRAHVARLVERDAAPGAALLERLAKERRAARVALDTMMRSPAYVDLLDRVAAAPATLVAVANPTRRRVVALARRPWRRLVRDIGALGAAPADEELHEVRLRAKRARYAAEAVTPVLGKPARRFARQLARLQDVLGEHQDAVVFEAWLRRAVAGRRSASEAFVAGALAAEEWRAAQAAQDAWRPVWRSVARAAPSMWS